MTKKMSAGNTHHTEFTPLRDVAEVLATSFRADGKSPKTIQGYTYALRLLDEHLQQTGRGSLHPSDVKATDIEALTAHIRETRSPQTAVIVWNSLRAVWSWMLRREEEFDARPIFARLNRPKADQHLQQTLTVEEADRILATTSGTRLIDRRDRAIILLLADTGMRRGEVAAVRRDDLDLSNGALLVRLTKTDRDRLVPLGNRTRTALRTYLRERDRFLDRTGHPDPGTLFINRNGRPLTGDGVYQLLVERAQQAGVDVGRAAHVWRHFFADRALASGMSEGDVMTIGGWTSARMIQTVYGASNRVQRAFDAHRVLSPADRLGTRTRDERP